jgi:hypothetical protein
MKITTMLIPQPFLGREDYDCLMRAAVAAVAAVAEAQ